MRISSTFSIIPTMRTKSKTEENLRPTITLSRIFGLYPYSGPNYKLTIKSTFIAVSFAAYLIFYNLNKFLKHSTAYYKATIVSNVMSCYDLLKIVSIVATISSPLLYRDDVEMFWESLYNAEMLLHELNIAQPSVQTRRKQGVKIMLFFTIVLTVFVVSYIKYGSVFHLTSIYTTRLVVLNMLFAKRAGCLVHEIMEDEHPEEVAKEIVSVIAPGVIFFAEEISNNYSERIRENNNNTTYS
ncbi:hypothetical protein LSTR_LSTR017356 [Laodelphax striatellus]|uniref:Uncharacterized protein n=1 Tax=Laodelphax striatellus TaxID=195883 RepID=A0A482WKJ8_LAOST|nr:hypothetical protein LSTR_LSTR017356 [Laodelphax striatellus]